MSRFQSPQTLPRRAQRLLGCTVAALTLIDSALGSAAAETKTALHAEPGPAHDALAQAYCGRRVSGYASNDLAFELRNRLLSEGYHAWIEAHGSLYAGTRTYVVFVALPC